MEKKPKPIDSVQLIVEMVGFFKSAAIVLSVMLIEWARAKQAHAEDKQAVAESDLAMEKAKNEIKDSYLGRDASDIVRDYLDSRKGDG